MTQYQSVFKINGIPILPPLMTNEKRLEMQKYRFLAIRCEEKLKRIKMLQQCGNSKKKTDKISELTDITEPNLIPKTNIKESEFDEIIDSESTEDNEYLKISNICNPNNNSPLKSIRFYEDLFKPERNLILENLKKSDTLIYDVISNMVMVPYEENKNSNENSPTKNSLKLKKNGGANNKFVIIDDRGSCDLKRGNSTQNSIQILPKKTSEETYSPTKIGKISENINKMQEKFEVMQDIRKDEVKENENYSQIKDNRISLTERNESETDFFLECNLSENAIDVSLNSSLNKSIDDKTVLDTNSLELSENSTEDDLQDQHVQIFKNIDLIKFQSLEDFLAKGEQIYSLPLDSDNEPKTLILSNYKANDNNNNNHQVEPKINTQFGKNYSDSDISMLEDNVPKKLSKITNEKQINNTPKKLSKFIKSKTIDNFRNLLPMPEIIIDPPTFYDTMTPNASNNSKNISNFIVSSVEEKIQNVSNNSKNISTSSSVEEKTGETNTSMIRSNSFTLESPSSALIEHLNKQQNKAKILPMTNNLRESYIGLKESDKHPKFNSRMSSPGKTLSPQKFKRPLKPVQSNQKNKEQETMQQHQTPNNFSKSSQTITESSTVQIKPKFRSPYDVKLCSSKAKVLKKHKSPTLKTSPLSIVKGKGKQISPKTSLSTTKINIEKIFHDFEEKHRIQLIELMEKQQQEQRKMQENFEKQQKILIEKLINSNKAEELIINSQTNSNERKSKDEILSENPTIIQRREQAATKINSYVRGYLIRRLFKTARVKNICDTIRQSITYLIEIHITNSKSGDAKTDVILKTRLLQQLKSSITLLHDIFSQFSIKARMNLIRTDRNLRLENS